uniref:Uncharacterized protein n=1 Tax=Oryza brachyantha TaxID=4533 RepID=J3LTL1_ORYBR
MGFSSRGPVSSQIRRQFHSIPLRSLLLPFPSLPVLYQLSSPRLQAKSPFPKASSPLQTLEPLSLSVCACDPDGGG